MKYFSHDLASREDDKCFEIIDTHGMAGYGFWWAILEELYKAEDSGFQIEATPIWIKRFSRDLNITDPRTITRYFDTFADLGLINKQMWQEHIIYSDGVMKRADAYMQEKIRKAKNKRDQRERDKQIKANVTDDNLDVTTESPPTISKCHHVTTSYPDPYSDPYSYSDPNTEEINKEILTVVKPTVVKNSDLEKFQEIYNQEKPELWAKCEKLNNSRIKKLKALKKELGDQAYEVWKDALVYCRGDTWYKTKNFSIDNFMTNDKILGLAERSKPISKESSNISSKHQLWLAEINKGSIASNEFADRLKQTDRKAWTEFREFCIENSGT